MKLSVPKDLTTGRPLPVIALYAVPMLISMFFQQAYNLIDGWIAGKHIGAVALGAVGTCYPVTVFFIAIASGLSLGASIFCSLEYGGKRYRQIQKAITTSFIAFIPLSVVLCAAGIGLSPFILKWLAVPEEALSAAGDYLIIYMAGLPFLFLYNISNGILTGIGDSKTPLVFLITSSCCNIVLDFAFVKVIPWGIRGLAFATLMSQVIASFLTAFAVKRVYLSMRQEKTTENEFFSGAVLKEILRLGIPSMIQHMFMSTGQLFLQNVINGYGTAVMAGYSISFRMNGLVINSLMALSNALSGFIAQNMGAAKYKRVRQGIRISLLIAVSFSLVIVVVLLAGGRGLLEFFVKDDQDKDAVIAAGLGFIRVVAPFYLLVCVKIISDGALRGIGAMTPFMIATMSDVVVRIACGRFFSEHWGIYGVWAIWPLAWLAGTIMSVGMYFFYRNKKIAAGPRAD